VFFNLYEDGLQMKIIAIIPIKSNSERVPEKNFRIINGKPLYRFLLDKMSSCNFDEVFVDTDSDEIKEYCNKNNLNIIDRLPSLARNDANGNDLLNYHASIIDADVYFQLFVTAPLLKVSTINQCINVMKSNEIYDSILTVEEIYSWFWFDNKPVNYEPAILPRSQDAKPIIKETTGLYGIRKDILNKNKCRIGEHPYFFSVQDDESIDLDCESDFIKLSNHL